jgi:serine/threonine protein kinase
MSITYKTSYSIILKNALVCAGIFYHHMEDQDYQQEEPLGLQSLADVVEPSSRSSVVFIDVSGMRLDSRDMETREMPKLNMVESDTQAGALPLEIKKEVLPVIIETHSQPFNVMPFGLEERKKKATSMDTALNRLVWTPLVHEFRRRLLDGVERSGKHARERADYYSRLRTHCFEHIDNYINNIANNETRSIVSVMRGFLYNIFIDFASPEKGSRDKLESDLKEYLQAYNSHKVFVEGSVNLIGKGAFGKVYEATFNRPRVKVALKVLIEKDSKGLSRIREEVFYMLELEKAESASGVYLAFRTPVDLPDIPDSKNHIIIVSEFIEGQTLSEVIEKKQVLPFQERLCWSLEVLAGIGDALHEIHEKKVLHRDLKPDNIKINLSDRVRLLDFGLSKRMGAFEVDEEDVLAHQAALDQIGVDQELSMSSSGDPRVDCDTKIETKGLCGTPYYMSPEQNGNLEMCEESESYVAMIIFLECVSGIRVFSGFDYMSLMHFMRALREDERNIIALVCSKYGEFISRAPAALRSFVFNVFENSPTDRPKPEYVSVYSRLLLLLMSDELTQKKYLLEYMQSRIKHGILKDETLVRDVGISKNIPSLLSGMQSVILSRSEIILAEDSLDELHRLSIVLDELIMASLLEVSDE